MKKLILILSILFLIVGCGTEEPKEESQVQEETVEVQEEPTSYIVEVDELQTQLLDEMNLDVLADKKQSNGSYEIPNDEKGKVLQSLDYWIDADCSDIWVDNDYLDKVYHSADYQLFRIYFNDLSQKDTFLTLYAKRLFEFGLIYNKFDEKNSWIFIILYDEKGNKIQTIDSDMLDL